MDTFEFGFDSAQVVTVNSVEKFEQKASKQKNIVSIVCFRKYSDGVLMRKTVEKGAPLTDEEREEYIAKTDKKIAENLGKPVEALTEVDRLDTSSPRFAMSRTHYIETNKIGTIRCLSTYNSVGEIVKKAQCCKIDPKDAQQIVATGIVVYPTDNDEVDLDLLSMKKQLNFFVWKLAATKFKKIEALYKNARNDNKLNIDLAVELDGDPKYQKQNITSMGGTASFLRDLKGDMDVKGYILDRGLKLFKSTDDVLGYKMDAAKLAEKLSGGSKPSNDQESRPQAVPYNNILGE